jgi:hypothetical protein
MRNLFYFLIWLFAGTAVIYAQEKLSDQASVSVITCGPGSELYTSFGHSAFRVHDPVNKLDRIYNYGTFNFNAPNFYLNFAKGNLIYMLSTSDFEYFLRVYNYENRWVKSQVLNLTPSEVNDFYLYLENNAKPQYRDYRYDFFYDNCATRIEDVTITVLKDKVQFSNDHIRTQKSHRDLIDDYAGTHLWGKLGIDLALGAVIDDEATADEYKFLPDFIFESFKHGKIKSNGNWVPLVKTQQDILQVRGNPSPKNTLSPLVVFLLLGILMAWVTLRDRKKSKRSCGFDFVVFLTTGLLGVAVLLLWFATTHTATYRNMNFLWAFAPNAVVAFYLLKKKVPQWILAYLKLLLGLLVVLVLLWVLGIQIFNTAFIPLFMVLAFRYVYLLQWVKQQN